MASMESIQVGSSALNLELLINRSNYKKWKLWVKTYLLSEDLWDVIETIGEPPKLEDDQAGYKAWTKKNAKALYVIQSSCGPEMFPSISETESAKTAWEALEQACKVQGFDVDNGDHYFGYKSFIEHVYSGAWEKAKKCLGEVDVRSVVVLRAIAGWGYEQTALHIAARIGHAHIVKDLVHLMTPEDCKTKTNSGNTALHLAAAQGHLHVVRELPVESMGEVQDKDGDTALHNAVNAGKLDVVKHLVKLMRQEDLQIKNHAGYTALHLAVNKGDMPMVKELVRKAKGENKQDFEHYIPFTTYVRNGDWDKANECLRQLDDPCRAIAAVDPRDDHGGTALHVAAMKGHLDVIKGLLLTLLKMRDHLELKFTEDFTTFGSRITLGINEELLMEKAKYMVEQFERTLEGALEIQDADDGFTPLHMAVLLENVDIVKEISHMMRQEGLEITCRSWSAEFGLSCWSVLHLPVIGGNIDIVKELVPLMRKEGLEIQDHNGNTALHHAVSKGNVDIVKELVYSMRPEGFNYVKNNLGFNALHLAVAKGHLHIVKELMPLMRPWALKGKDHQDYTALGYAIVFLTDGDASEIAKYIAEKDAALFGITSGPEDDIPVVQALRLNKWELACHLYKLTPLELLNRRVGSKFLCYCFDRKQFDLAWDLLHHYPKIAVTVHGRDKTSPMLKLSRMSYAFLSGSQLTSCQRWIYNRIPIGKVAQVNIHDVSIDVSPSEDDHQNTRDLISSVIHFFRRFVEGLYKLCGIHNLYEMKWTHKKIFEILRCMAEATKNDDLGQDQFDTVKTSIYKAIQQGHFELVTNIFEENPKLWGKLLKDKRVKGIFHFAIESRQKEVYSLIYRIEEKERRDVGISIVNGDYNLLHYAANLSSHPEFDHIQDACLQMQRELQWFKVSIFMNRDYNLLHYAANLSSHPEFDHIQDACLQMQRELQWFKEVEKVVPSEMYEHRDRSNDMTARELFTKNHKKLLEDAEISIKGTATSCTVVGALIVTIMFAAIFTVPGGNDDTTGLLRFVNHKLVKVYIVSDTISLVSSTSSIITFLGILTSRYAENDFLISLPTKIMIGLITLFFAIVNMVIVFSCALLIMLGSREAWIVRLSILLTSVPVILFVWLLFPLLIKTFMSTYGPEIFDKKKQTIN